MSACFKLPLNELDEFVLLLFDNGKENINALIGLEEEKMQRFKVQHVQIFKKPNFPRHNTNNLLLESQLNEIAFTV